MPRRLKLLWKTRPLAVVSCALLVTAAAFFGIVHLARATPSVPTIEVRRGEFIDRLQIRGEVKAMKSITLTAPSGAGDLQILKLAKSGTSIKAGDIAVQFDTTQLKNTVDQKNSELKQAEAEIEGSRAQSRLTEEQDVTALAKAKFDVERARLDASKQEILSQIDGEKAKLALRDAEQALVEAQQKLQSDRAGAAADIASKQQKRDKALFDLRQAQTNFARMTLKSPLDGMVTILTTWRGPSGQSEWREGDRPWSGAAIAELPDLSTLRFAGRVDETERGQLKPGQTVDVRVDAVPDKDFVGKVADISPLTKADFSSWPVQKSFDVQVQVDNADSRMRPGMSATARIATDRIPDAIIIPADASFHKNGRTVVYVLDGGSFSERAIEVARRNNNELAVAKGLRAGERIATKDPTLEPETK